MIKNSFLIVTIFLIYFISDFFFNDAMLYILGGTFGIVARALALKHMTVFIWIIFLIGAILLYYYCLNKILKYSSIVLVGVLLYLLDFVLYEIMPNIRDSKTMYIHLGISILIKSTALILIIYFKNKWLMRSVSKQ